MFRTLETRTLARAENYKSLFGPFGPLPTTILPLPMSMLRDGLDKGLR
jgi:hypothetical protein